ncbi:hypothetical protein VO54_02492 [Elizabethkingia miricola]|nr:hypothetical protein VO54_02492 [Elizabethkingia miricola]
MFSDYQKNNQIETSIVQFVLVYIFGKIKLIIQEALDAGAEIQITGSGFYEKPPEKQVRFYE